MDGHSLNRPEPDRKRGECPLGWEGGKTVNQRGLCEAGRFTGNKRHGTGPYTLVLGVFRRGREKSVCTSTLRRAIVCGQEDDGCSRNDDDANTGLKRSALVI